MIKDNLFSLPKKFQDLLDLNNSKFVVLDNVLDPVLIINNSDQSGLFKVSLCGLEKVRGKINTYKALSCIFDIKFLIRIPKKNKRSKIKIILNWVLYFIYY